MLKEKEKKNSKKISEKKILVHFDQADPAGLLFFGSYFPIAHRFMEEFLSSLFPWKDWYSHPDWGACIRHTEAEYCNPLFAGDFCTLTLFLKKMGKSSLSFEVSFHKEKVLSAKLGITLAFVDKKEKKKREIPEYMRGRLIPFLST